MGTRVQSLSVLDGDADTGAGGTGAGTGTRTWPSLSESPPTPGGPAWTREEGREGPLDSVVGPGGSTPSRRGTGVDGVNGTRRSTPRRTPGGAHKDPCRVVASGPVRPLRGHRGRGNDVRPVGDSEVPDVVTGHRPGEGRKRSREVFTTPTRAPFTVLRTEREVTDSWGSRVSKSLPPDRPRRPVGAGPWILSSGKAQSCEGGCRVSLGGVATCNPTSHTGRRPCRRDHRRGDRTKGRVHWTSATRSGRWWSNPFVVVFLGGSTGCSSPLRTPSPLTVPTLERVNPP